MRHGWPEARIQTFLEDLERLALRAPGQLRLKVVAEDPSDDRYLECAVEGEAVYLVTGDDHLLRLRRVHEVALVTPKEFLQALRRERKPRA
jgi:hypothetical protein